MPNTSLTIPSQNSISRRMPTTDRAMLDLIARCLNRVSFHHKYCVIDEPPTDEERSSLERRLEYLDRALTPARGAAKGQARIQLAVAVTLGGFPSIRGDATGMIASYIAQLEQYPAWAVEKACEDIPGGGIEGMSRDFPPTAARLAQSAYAHTAAFKQERAQIQKVLSARIAMLPDPAEQMRVADGFRKLKDALQQPADLMLVEKKAAANARNKERGEREILAEYEYWGVTPVRDRNGLLISYSLAKNLGTPMSLISVTRSGAGG